MLKAYLFPAALLAGCFLTGILIYLYAPEKDTPRQADAAAAPTTSDIKKEMTPDIMQFRENLIRDMRRTTQTKAVILRSKLTDNLPEGNVSCLGRVTRQLPGEEWPVDAQGKRLEPLATIYVPDFPGVPEPLRKMALITIFAPSEAWAENMEEKPQLGCVIRAYPTLEGLEPCDYVSEEVKTCLLTPEAVENDMPIYPGIGGGYEWWPKFRDAEALLDIDYREDVCDAVYETHKIGGYPSFLQDPPMFPAGFAFALQITCELDAGLLIGDCGNYYFYYNAEKNEWRVYADFG